MEEVENKSNENGDEMLIGRGDKLVVKNGEERMDEGGWKGIERGKKKVWKGEEWIGREKEEIGERRWKEGGLGRILWIEGGNEGWIKEDNMEWENEESWEVIKIEDGVRIKMIEEEEGEFKIVKIGLGRWEIGEEIEIEIVKKKIVERMEKKEKGKSIGGNEIGERVRKEEGEKKEKVIIGREDGMWELGGIGRDDELCEGFKDILRGLIIESNVERENEEKGRKRIEGEWIEVGLINGGRLRKEEWIGVIDDGKGWGEGGIELGKKIKRRIGIVDVVIGKMIEMKMGRSGKEGEILEGEIKERSMVRVLKVENEGMKIEGKREIGRSLLVDWLGKKVGNGRVIRWSERKGIGGKIFEEGKRKGEGMILKLRKEVWIIGRVKEGWEIGVVIGRREDNRREENVDIIEGSVVVEEIEEELIERIKIDEGKIDEENEVLLNGREMLRVVEKGEKEEMEWRMKSIEEKINDLRKEGDLG